MTVELVASLYPDDKPGIYISCVVPAPARCTHCNFSCAFCANKLAGETGGEFPLTFQEYRDLLTVALQNYHVRAIGIHGYEPLEPGESWRTVRMIANLADRYGVPLRLVTNGSYLEERSVALTDALVDRVFVSVHSGDPLLHESVVHPHKGFENSLEQIESGVRAFLRHRRNKGRMGFSSTILPKKHYYLEGVVELAALLEVPEVVFNPLIPFDGKRCFAEEDFTACIQTAQRHHELGKKLGVNVSIEGALSFFGKDEDEEEKQSLFRITPNTAAFAVNRRQFLLFEPRITYGREPSFLKTHFPQWAR
jgi:MoaA/NifB/PqqE/SkfB family radical SAM enzyme